MPNPDILSKAFEEVSKSVAEYILQSLEKTLQEAIQNKVNEIIHEATKDVNDKILSAISHIQPIQIPINLLAQPFPQNTAPPAPIAPIAPTLPSTPATSPAPAAPPNPIAAQKVAENKPQKKPADTPVPPAPQKTIEAVEALGQEEQHNDTPTGEKPDNASATHYQPMPSAALKEKLKPQKLTIVGLKPGQAHMIKNEYKFAKISFISATARNNKQLTDLGKGNNPIIFMTDFIRHAAVETGKSVSDNWHYVSGGMTALREKIENLLAESVAA